MDNNFGIKLNANIDELSLKTNIESFFSKNTFKIKVDIDSSNLGNSFKGTSKGKAQSGGALANPKSSKPFSGTFNLSGEEDKITATLDENNQLISARIDKIQDLKNKSTEYYTVSEDGELELQKTIASSNLGRKEALKLQERNEATTYKLKKSIESYGSQTKLSKKEVAKFNAELSNVSNIQDELEKSKALEKLNTDIKAAANSSGILGQSFGKAMVKYVTWLGIAKIVATITNSIKKMVSEVIALDNALVELNKVLDGTDAELQAIKKQAFEVADAVGGTGEEVLKATTEFKRMGYAVDESLHLAKLAVMMTNVAEGINDTGEAANILTSILKGTNTEIKYAESLLDRLNEIANNNAVSFDALAKMTQESAATMKILGNNLDETMGLLTGAYEILQDESVARGIQTIGLRIAGLNEDMESVAGLSNQVVEALQKYAGINAFDSQTGQLKNTYTILQELAAVWDTINKNQQSALLNTLAGKQQADVASAILNNWKGVESAVEDASNSMGSAQRENERAMDSIQGSIKRVQNSFQKLADTIMSSDFVKGIVDVGAGILDLIQHIMDLINKLGGLKTVVLLVASAFLILKAQAIASTIKSVIQFAVTVIPKMIAKLVAWTSATWAQFTAQMSLQNALTLGVASVGIIAGIAAVTIAVKNLTKETYNAVDANNSLNDSYSDLAQSYADMKDNLSDYDAALNKLRNDIASLIETNKEKLAQSKKEQEQLENQRELQEKLLEVEKARQALAEAKNKKVRVYRSGVGFVYEQDAAEVQSAQADLQETLNELADFRYDLALERAEDFIEELNDLLTSGTIVEGWDGLFSDFGDLLDTEFEDYILKAKDFMEEFNSTINSGNTLEEHRKAVSDYNKSLDEEIGKLEERMAILNAFLSNEKLSVFFGEETKAKMQGEVSTIESQIAELKSLYRDMPKNAKGTKYWKGGTTWVGENGPELVNLPKGSEILSSDKSIKLHDMINKSPNFKQGQGITTLQFNGPLNFPNVTSESDAEGFINELISIGNNSIPKLT